MNYKLPKYPYFQLDFIGIHMDHVKMDLKRYFWQELVNVIRRASVSRSKTADDVIDVQHDVVVQDQDSK